MTPPKKIYEETGPMEEPPARIYIAKPLNRRRWLEITWGDFNIEYTLSTEVDELVKALESAKGEIHYSTCETMDEQSILPRQTCDCEVSEIWEAIAQYRKEK